MVLVQFYTVMRGRKSKAYAKWISMVFLQWHTVLISECLPLKLVLHTLEQVQSEIDKLDDPRLTEKLTVEVDDEDREAILKKVNCFVV